MQWLIKRLRQILTTKDIEIVELHAGFIDFMVVIQLALHFFPVTSRMYRPGGSFAILSAYLPCWIWLLAFFGLGCSRIMGVLLGNYSARRAASIFSLALWTYTAGVLVIAGRAEFLLFSMAVAYVSTSTLLFFRMGTQHRVEQRIKRELQLQNI